MLINLDPANTSFAYKCDINITTLIDLNTAMTEHKLGPNGGILYCIEYLELNVQWLLDQLLAHKGKYFIFDCPGQVELFTNHHSMRNILRKIEKLNIRVCVVNLVESHYCHDPSRYISMIMVSLRTMLELEQPHINILSKIDLIEKYGSLGIVD